MRGTLHSYRSTSSPRLVVVVSLVVVVIISWMVAVVVVVVGSTVCVGTVRIQCRLHVEGAAAHRAYEVLLQHVRVLGQCVHSGEALAARGAQAHTSVDDPTQQ